MRNLNLFTEAQFLDWYQEVAMVHRNMMQAIVPLTKENILTEEEVCELLGVTDRTLRTYRQKQYIGFAKLAGRIIYIRNLLYLDLLMMYYAPKEEK